MDEEGISLGRSLSHYDIERVVIIDTDESIYVSAEDTDGEWHFYYLDNEPAEWEALIQWLDDHDIDYSIYEE